jgi:hypothetical protein
LISLEDADGLLSLTEASLNALQVQLEEAQKSGTASLVEQKVLRQVQKAAYELGLKLTAPMLRKVQCAIEGWFEQQGV